ncbi:acyl-CoA thioesterase [Saccharospirillum sp.]
MHSGQQRLGIPTVHIVLDIQALAALDEVVWTSLQVVELRRSAIELEVVARCDKQARFSARVTLIMAHAVQGRLRSMTIPAALRQTMLEDLAARPEIEKRDVAETEYLAFETQELMSAPRFHECERPVYFQDCDPAQIVFYPRYLEMIDDVIDDWLSSMGIRECRVHAVDVDFQRPSQLGEALRFTLQLLGAKDARIYVAVSAACEGSSRIGAKLELSFPGAGI